MSGSYSFQVIFYGSVEFWLSPDSLPVNAVLYETSTPVVVTRLARKILSEQEAKMNHFTVPLVADKKQYIEIIHATGYGLFSMYKSGWIVVGGMDSSQFKGIWGFEDNDLANRVLKSGYVIFRLIIRDFFHQNHTYAGLWDGKKF